MAGFDAKDYRARVLLPMQDEFDTAQELPDPFTRYGLALEVEDEREISEALEKVPAFWSKEKTNPRFKTLLGVLNSDQERHEAERVLLDREARRLLRAKVEADRKRKRAARFKDMDTDVALVAAKGYVTPQEVEALRQRYVVERGFAAEELDQRLQHIPRKEPPPPLQPKPGLPADVRERIRSNLAALGLADLYEFLQLKPPLTPAKLRPAYSEREREWRPKPADHRKSCAVELLGIVKTYLVDGDAADYEHGRRWEMREKLREHVKVVAADKRITEQESNYLIKVACDLGMDAAAASECIRGLAAELGASLDMAAAENSVRCASCFSAYPVDTAPERCKVCNRELWQTCPKCQSRAPQTVTACGNCHFEFESVHTVRLLVRRAELALAAGLLADAESLARQAEEIWGGRDGDVQKLREKIEAAQTRLKDLCAQYDDLRAKRKLFAASSLLAAFPSTTPDFQFPGGRRLGDVKAQLEAELRRVEEHLQQARAAERAGDADRAMACYADALAIASDCQDALRGVGRNPPAAAGPASASVQGKDVVVQWAASPTKGVEYIVVCREGRPPENPGDGREVEHTPALSCRDTAAPAGVPVFYSVFADRWGVTSPASGTGEVLAIEEIRDFEVKPGDGTVTGSWLPVPQQGRVCVVRKQDGPPADYSDGTPVLVHENGFVDPGVLNGFVQHYRAWVEYRSASGAVVRTAGLVRHALPQGPPKPVTDLRFESRAGGVGLKWSAPAGCPVRIYRAAQAPRERSGAKLPLTGLAALGTPLPFDGPGCSHDEAPGGTLVYYVPVTQGPEFAVIGVPRSYIAVAEVAGVAALDLSTRLQLTWRWPAGCGFVWVAWREKAYPEAPDAPGATAQKVTREDYDRQRCFEIANPGPGPYRFTVFAGASAGGQEVWSPGVDQGCRAELRTVAVPELRYELVRGRGLLGRKEVTLRLTASADVTPLPELVVVARKGGVPPLSPQEGEVLARFRGLRLLANRPAEQTFDLLKAAVCVRLFFSDQRDHSRFRLLEPPPQQLRM